MLTSYIKEDVEAEDMLRVKSGVKTDRPCHRKFLLKENMPFCTPGTSRCLKRTTEMINDLN